MKPKKAQRRGRKKKESGLLQDGSNLLYVLHIPPHDLARVLAGPRIQETKGRRIRWMASCKNHQELFLVG